MTRLPQPEQWYRHVMSEVEVAMMIEKHIAFYEEKDDGGIRYVSLPRKFVKAAMEYAKRANLPICVAIASMPIVLANGELLALEYGHLDEQRGIEFRIPPEVRAVVPRLEDCTEQAVRAAMSFLLDEWLCDVATDFAGKVTLIAIGLSVLERSLFAERPAFFLSAGRRGCGKTTTTKMVLIGVTGAEVAAVTWSYEEEERRKALMSYLMQGVPFILWDNIRRGTQIDCPHIERSCTASTYADRKLGVSEAVATSASVIHIFTGNNVSPRGGVASRSLQITLTTDRDDPENRAFKHTDPVQ